MNDYEKIEITIQNVKLFVSSNRFDAEGTGKKKRKLIYMEGSRYIEKDVDDERLRSVILRIGIFDGLRDLNDEGSVRIQGSIDNMNCVEILLFQKGGEFVSVNAPLANLYNLCISEEGNFT